MYDGITMGITVEEFVVKQAITILIRYSRKGRCSSNHTTRRQCVGTCWQSQVLDTPTTFHHLQQAEEFRTKFSCSVHFCWVRFLGVISRYFITFWLVFVLINSFASNLLLLDRKMNALPILLTVLMAEVTWVFKDGSLHINAVSSAAGLISLY